MNTNLSLDVNNLADKPVTTILELEVLQRRVAKTLTQVRETLLQQAPLILSLESQDVSISFDLKSTAWPIEIRFSGDGDKLTEIWRLLRRAGYTPTSHPQKGSTAFCCGWSCPDAAGIFMFFSSTACRRVQVGVKLVETPIYETVCGELPQLESLPPSVEPTLLEA